jgi:hypothetical protein
MATPPSVPDRASRRNSHSIVSGTEYADRVRASRPCKMRSPFSIWAGKPFGPGQSEFRGNGRASHASGLEPVVAQPAPNKTKPRSNPNVSCTPRMNRDYFTWRGSATPGKTAGARTAAPLCKLPETSYAFSNSFSIAFISGESVLDLLTAQTMAANATKAITMAMAKGDLPLPPKPGTA